MFAQIVSSGLLVLSAILAWIVFIKVGILAEDPTDKAYTVELLRWVTVGLLYTSAPADPPLCSALCCPLSL